MKNFFITILLLFFYANSYAATLEVGADRTYSTIQSAVNAAQAGDTVLVYPGTYNESVRIPDRKQGTANSPIIIKARYAARKPLNGGDWADTADKRSVVNASGTPGVNDFGFYNNTPAFVRNIIIDGFYIQNATDSGIYFSDDSDIWIRNNISINNGYYTTYGSPLGSYVLTRVPNHLLQNNSAELSVNAPNSTIMYMLDGADSIAEYNECYLTSASSNGRCFYVRLNSIRFVFRYNYIHLDAISQAEVARFRDTVGFQIINNYIRASVPQYFMVVHEDVDRGRIENHKINNNTFVYEQGAIGKFRELGLGFLNNSEVKNSIFYSGVNDTNSYAVGEAWSGSPSYSVTIDNNVWYNFLGLVNPNLTGYTETNSQNINPNVNPDTGCASSVDNNIYGANLDISNIPYRKCDGTFYPIAGKFGVNTTRTPRRDD